MSNETTDTPRTEAQSSTAVPAASDMDLIRILERELNEARAALALGQINCDAEYDRLRSERDTAAEREASLRTLLQEALAYEAAQFDGPADEDLNVSGADLVDWFAEWRLRVKAALAERGASLRPDGTGEAMLRAPVPDDEP